MDSVQSEPSSNSIIDNNTNTIEYWFILFYLVTNNLFTLFINLVQGWSWSPPPPTGNRGEITLTPLFTHQDIREDNKAIIIKIIIIIAISSNNITGNKPCVVTVKLLDAALIAAYVVMVTFV